MATEPIRPNPDSPWATLDEAAHHLRMSRPTVVRLIESGDLPGRKIGKKWRIPWTAISPDGSPPTITPRYSRTESSHTDDPLDVLESVGA